uniref:hypothetical protein n=1 Tax=Nitrospira cf. moscoviensis SBR1015 TaxID=96242 RepID=UPI0011247D32
MQGTDKAVIALNLLLVAAVCVLALVLGGCEARGADAAPMWYRFPAEKPVADGAYSPTILDLERHLPARHGRSYWFADPITHAHETTHGINADLAGRHDKGWHGYYVLNNWCMYLPEPKVRMADVVRALPAGLRRGRFQLYLVDQVQRHPWWEVAPVKAVFDEWVAYTNGATAGLELIRGGKSLAQDDRYFACLEFSVYAAAV